MAAKYEHFLLTSPVPHVTHVEINRPNKLNAFTRPMWLELRDIFNALSISPDIRAVILSGAGEKAFTAGLDLQANTSSGGFNLGGEEDADTARKIFANRLFVKEFQECISAIQECSKPVICVLHGFSLGLAIDIACATDIRVASKGTKFSVKEVDIGIAADIGTLSRLPKVVGNLSWVKEVCLTARIFGAEEAAQVGFVSAVGESKEDALKKATAIAGSIASKSPVATLGTKEIINYSIDRPISEGKYFRASLGIVVCIADGTARSEVYSDLERWGYHHKRRSRVCYGRHAETQGQVLQAMRIPLLRCHIIPVNRVIQYGVYITSSNSFPTSDIIASTSHAHRLKILPKNPPFTASFRACLFAAPSSAVSTFLPSTTLTAIPMMIALTALAAKIPTIVRLLL